MATLFDSVSTSHHDVSDFDPERDCIKVTSVTLKSTPGFSVFANISIGPRHFRDIGASCACQDLRLLKYADSAYSLCAQHGFQTIGTFARATAANGRPA